MNDVKIGFMSFPLSENFEQKYDAFADYCVKEFGKLNYSIEIKKEYDDYDGCNVWVLSSVVK